MMVNIPNASVPVLHPAGNIAEFLVGAGLARVVDWHAGMLAAGGGMERLRAAEKSAKEKRACLYASAPALAAAKSGGTTISGNRAFEGQVVRIWSGDQISVVEKDTGKERRIQLSSTRGPKYHDSFAIQFFVSNSFRVGFQTLSKPFMLKRLGSSCARSS